MSASWSPEDEQQAPRRDATEAVYEEPAPPPEDERFGDAGDEDGRYSRPEADRFREGFVPPPGPLPQRFGPPPVLISLWRAALAFVAVAVVAVGAGIDLTDGGLDLRELIWPALVLAFIAFQAWRRRRRREQRISARTVLVEPIGLIVSTGFSRRRIAWGELVGVEAPAPGQSQWVLHARRGGAPFLVELPPARWSERLGRALRGEHG
jgi:hypothetical protein